MAANTGFHVKQHFKRQCCETGSCESVETELHVPGKVSDRAEAELEDAQLPDGGAE